MKTTSLKAFLILSGLMFIGAGTMRAGIINQFNSSMNNEISNFNIQGLYVIVGIVTAGLAFYFISNVLNGEEKHFSQKSNYVRPHRRTVIKKTA